MQNSVSLIKSNDLSLNVTGQKFAMLEIKALVAHLLYHFDMEAIEQTDKVILLQDITMRPGQSLFVKFNARKV